MEWYFGMKVVETVCARICVKLKIKFDIVHVFFITFSGRTLPRLPGHPSTVMPVVCPTVGSVFPQHSRPCHTLAGDTDKGNNLPTICLLSLNANQRRHSEALLTTICPCHPSQCRHPSAPSQALQCERQKSFLTGGRRPRSSILQLQFAPAILGWSR